MNLRILRITDSDVDSNSMVKNDIHELYLVVYANPDYNNP